jgi:hypothetical protein
VSKTLWDHGVYISTYAGPEREVPEYPRKRIQIMRRDQFPDLNAILTVSLEQWRDICDAVAVLGPDCEGEEI